MSPSRKPMPSFTLVLTSGHHSLSPTTFQFDSNVSPSTLPTAPDYLMKTIDLRDEPKDVFKQGVDAQNIFEAEKPATAEETSNNFIKQNLLLLIRKFVSYKRKFINNGSLVALKPSLN